MALARALVGQPSLYLLDEVTSALDPATARLVEELLLETKLSMPELAAALFALMRRGFITETFKNCYIRRL